uniref:serine hydrolase domain-containing protein n=1 Tax=uncultured Draconibacterium sp. TaxID=1573823 RepID=UPI003217F896
MKKEKFYLVLVIAILAVLTITLKSYVQSPIEEKEKTEVKNKEPEYNPAIEIKNSLTEFDSILNVNLKQSGTVGAAVVVTYKGKIALLKCFGVRKAGEKDPVDENTIFRLASVSKSITGVLAGILDDEKIIDLDDKVIDYLPDFQLKNPESTQQLTVRHLLSHTSGLIPHAYDLMVEDHVPLDKIIKRLNEVDLTAPPGQLYGYQNVVYSIYDPITSSKTHKSFNSVIEEKVFEPFGMEDASTGFEAFKNNRNKAYPHYNRGHNRFSPMRLNDRYYNTSPAAGINASISDLAHFLVALTDENSDVISEKARETVFTPQVKSPLKRAYFSSWGRGVQSKQYSIGWRIVNYKGRKIAYHGGYVLGYKAEIALCEEEEIGIALLCNSPNSSTAQNIPTFLNIMFEEKDKLALENNKEEDHTAAKS